MNDLIYLDKNNFRGLNKVRKSLQLLKHNGMIDYPDTELKKDIVKIRWVNLFPENKDNGWIKFQYNDFDIFEKVGVDFYCVMWILRMYVNHDTGTSFLKIKDIAKLVSCKAIQVQRAVDLFEYAGLFEVKRGEYYLNEIFDEWHKKNNTYKYTGDLEWIVKLNNYNTKI